MGKDDTHLQIELLLDYARYSDILESIIAELKGSKVLRLSYESDCQGFVDIDCEIKGGRVFTYRYDYGSCPQCDEWQDRGLTDSTIKDLMLKEATIYENVTLYNEWRAMCAMQTYNVHEND